MSLYSAISSMIVVSYPWKILSKIDRHEVKTEKHLGVQRTFCYHESQLYISTAIFRDQRFKGMFFKGFFASQIQTKNWK